MLGDHLKHFWADRIDHSKKDIQLYSFFYLPMQVVENITNKQFSAVRYILPVDIEQRKQFILKKVFHWINEFNFWSIGGTSSCSSWPKTLLWSQSKVYIIHLVWVKYNPILSSLFFPSSPVISRNSMIDLKAILQQCMAFWLSSLEKNLKDNNTVVCQHHQASLKL